MSQWCGGLLSRLLYASLLALETLLDPVIMSPFADSVPTLVLKIIESRKKKKTEGGVAIQGDY